MAVEELHVNFAPSVYKQSICKQVGHKISTIWNTPELQKKRENVKILKNPLLNKICTNRLSWPIAILSAYPIPHNAWKKRVRCDVTHVLKMTTKIDREYKTGGSWKMRVARENTTRPGYKRNARQQCSTHFKSNDTTMPRLNADSRQRALGNLEAGMDARQVARAFGVHVSTIYSLTDRFLQNNNVVDHPRSGRPRVTSQRQDRNIVRTHMRDRFLPATTTARQTVGTHNRPVSHTTVWRRLIAVHLNCRRPYIGQRITQRHRIARHNWAVLHRQWQNRQWQNIVFSDESRYCVDRADSRMRVWRRRGERFTDACVMERDSWGGPSVMLWGAISWGRRVQPVIFENNGRGHGRGVAAQHYTDEVLTPVVVPVFAGSMSDGLPARHTRHWPPRHSWHSTTSPQWTGQL